MSLFRPHIIPFYRIAKVLRAISNLLLFVLFVLLGHLVRTFLLPANSFSFLLS